MSDEAQAVEAPQAITMEDLFPHGSMTQAPKAEAPKEQPEEEVKAESEDEDLAEVQETEEEQEVAEESPEVAIGRMRLKDFLDAAGVSMEEFYRDVYVEKDGKEVSVSEAWDQHKTIKEANDALLRERSELQKRLDSQATVVPNAQVSPDADALMAEARIHTQRLQAIMGNPDIANTQEGLAAQVQLKFAIDNLKQQAQAKQVEWVQSQQEKIKQALDERDRQTRSLIPEWNDAQVQATEWRGIADMMAAYGIQETDIRQFNPQVRRLLRDSWRATNQAKRIEQGAKRIRKVPKTLPSASRAPIASKMTKAQAQEQASQEIKSAKTRDERLRTMLKVDLG